MCKQQSETGRFRFVCVMGEAGAPEDPDVPEDPGVSGVPGVCSGGYVNSNLPFWEFRFNFVGKNFSDYED